MHPRQDILLAICVTAIAFTSAQACPNDSPAAARLAPASRSAAALVAWKPQAWVPGGIAPRATQGLRVAIDPVDGVFGMPVPDDLQQQVRIGDDATVPVMRRNDGSGRATLDERFADFAVVTLGADGKPRWGCVHGPTAASRFLKQPPAAAVAPAPGTAWEDK